MMFVGSFAYADIDNMDIGGDILLEYFFAKEFDLNDSPATPDETDFLRSEIHLWFQADLDDNITARISLEADRAFSHDSFGSVGGTNELDWDNFGDLEIFLEEAFIKIADIWGSGFTLSAGRQFLNYGDNPNADDFNRWWGPGFIIADSASYSPLLLTDLGSYEIDPFDAIVLSYETEQARVDVIHARDVEDFYNNNLPGLDDDATMWALYGSYFGIEGHQLDLYATYNDENMEWGSLSDFLPFDGERIIVGGRAAGDLTEEVAYKAEVAYQFDNRNGVGMGPLEADGFGAQAGINYHPDVDRSPNIGILYTFLQQDGVSPTGGFAAPYEGKTYGMIAEGIFKVLDPASFLSNMHVFNLNGGLLLADNVAWTADFYYFLLQDDVADEDEGGFEFDSQIDYQFNDNLVSFLGGGVFFPGDYAKTMYGGNDEAFFVRAGLKVNF
jgi:hypothetical protein